MTDLGTSTSQYGGSYFSNSTSSETSTVTGPYSATATFTPVASEAALGTGPYKANATFTPVAIDPSQITFQPEASTTTGGTSFRRVGLGAPPG